MVLGVASALLGMVIAALVSLSLALPLAMEILSLLKESAK